MVRSRSLLWSFDYAIRGIVYAIRTQRNMRLHMIAAASVIVLALMLRVSGLELIALLFAIGLVLVAELVNTAVEAAVDLAVETFDPLAAVAKDVAAGAVLVAAITAVAVGYVVFFARLTPDAQSAMETAQTSSATVTLLALALTRLGRPRHQGGHPREGHVVRARRLAERAHGDRVRDRRRYRLLVQFGEGDGARAVHRGARGPEPRRDGGAHDRADRRRWRHRFPADHGGLSDILEIGGRTGGPTAVRSGPSDETGTASTTS